MSRPLGGIFLTHTVYDKTFL